MSNETNKQYNSDIYDPFETIGFYDMPVIRKTKHMPKSLLGFNYAKSSKKYESGIHFFLTIINLKDYGAVLKLI